MSNSFLYKLKFEWDVEPSPFDRNGVLLEFLMLILTGFLYFALLLLREYSFKFRR